MSGAERSRRLASCIAPGLAILAGWTVLAPRATTGHSQLGGSLSLEQRDVRVFDNFQDAEANDSTAGSESFPGATGAARAIWKASVEWGSTLHGDGQGDPHQPGGLGSGQANFDATWQGLATSPGGTNDNVHSGVAGASGGILAYCETPISDGWRIRYYDAWLWDDEPAGPILGARDLQGVATHEYGHALGLGHSTVIGSTMFATIAGNGVAQRSIEPDDRAGVQAVYGAVSATKPRIDDAVVDAAAQTVTVHGAHFAATDNEVWFTRGTPTPPAADARVRISGVSSPDGASLTVGIPPAAGPGDVLVRVPGAGHDALSNAWPIDPASSGSLVGPPMLAAVQPAQVPALASTPTIVALTGSRLGAVDTVRVDGVALDPARFQVVDEHRVEVELPLIDRLGPVAIELESPLGASAPGALQVLAATGPVVRFEGTNLTSFTPARISLGAPVGHSVWLAGSLVLQPSAIPGRVAIDIGNQFATLWILSLSTIPAQGWVQQDYAVSGLAPGTQIYVQAVSFDPSAPAWPLLSSNVAVGHFLF